MDSETKTALELWAKGNGFFYSKVWVAPSDGSIALEDAYGKTVKNAKNKLAITTIDLDFCIEVSKLVDQEKYINELIKIAFPDGLFSKVLKPSKALMLQEIYIRYFAIHNATISDRLKAIHEAGNEQ